MATYLLILLFIIVVQSPNHCVADEGTTHSFTKKERLQCWDGLEGYSGFIKWMHDEGRVREKVAVNCPLRSECYWAHCETIDGDIYYMGCANEPDTCNTNAFLVDHRKGCNGLSGDNEFGSFGGQSTWECRTCNNTELCNNGVLGPVRIGHGSVLAVVVMLATSMLVPFGTMGQ